MATVEKTLSLKDLSGGLIVVLVDALTSHRQIRQVAPEYQDMQESITATSRMV